MIEQMTIEEFLKFLSTANGDEVIDKISQFQSCGLCVAGFTAEDFDNE